MKNALKSLCVKRIAPMAAAIIFAASGTEAFASTAGRAAIEAKLTPAYIPTLKAATPILKAKSADLLVALSLALQDPTVTLTADDLAGSALEVDALGKYRTDKDKIAGQIVATTIAAENLSSNAAAVSAVASAVFNVNSATTKAKLTAAGQASVITAVIKGADSTANATTGAAIANVFTGDSTLLLTNTAKALGATGSAASAASLTNFVSGFIGVEVPAGGREVFVVGAAAKVAAANPAAAGAFFGGLVLSNPTAYDSNAEIETLITSNVLGGTSAAKLAKGVGEIIALTAGAHTNKGALATTLATGKTATAQALITQGLLRAGGTSDVDPILNATLPAVAAKSLPTFAGTVIKGTGSDPVKSAAIAAKIAAGQGTTGKTNIGSAAVNSVALLNPEAAEAVTAAIIDTNGGSDFLTDETRLKFGQTLVQKSKSNAAAGFIAKTIIQRNIAGSATPLTDAAAVATSLMIKKAAAATDIAQRAATLTDIPPAQLANFVEALADANKKYTLNAAVGVSIVDPQNADTYTTRAITHDLTDKAALGAAAKIAGAVATAVDEEEASYVGKAVANIMSVKGSTSGKPVSITLAAATATALAKAIQTKPGVTVVNRMDELGELAAAMVKNLVNKNGTDTKGLAAEVKLIAAVAGAITKSLSKTAVLSGNPNSSAEANLVAITQTKLADQWEARDIAGSIAQTILADATMTAAQKTAILGTAATVATSPLAKAILPASGKKGSATYNAVIAAITEVLNGTSGTKYEVDAVRDETDTRNG